MLSDPAQTSAPLSPALRRAAVSELLRRDFGAFNARAFEALQGHLLEPNWHLAAITHVLEQVASGEITRLLITMPPRSLKSHMVSVAFPAWLMGRDPSRKVIATSYGEDLAVTFANDWRRLLEAPWYRTAFANARISPRKNREGETHLTKGGMRLSLSAGGQLTGRGADLIIIDDPLKASDAYSEPARTRINHWFGQTVVSRLNDKRSGAIIVVMQRLHPDDLAGQLIEAGGWHHLNLPAVAQHDQNIPLSKGRHHSWSIGALLQPDREPQAVLEDLKATLGSRDFNAQYLQTPVTADGNLIKLKYFGRDRPPPPIGKSREVVISVDTANSGSATADYSAVQIWEILGTQYYLADVRRGQWEYPELRDKVAALSERYGHPRILIEEAGVGFGLIKDLKREGHSSFAIKPTGSKEQRLARVVPIIESELVHLPETAPWLSDLEAEFAAFPAGRNDDQVDAMTQFLIWATEKRQTFGSFTPLRIGV